MKRRITEGERWRERKWEQQKEKKFDRWEKKVRWKERLQWKIDRRREKEKES